MQKVDYILKESIRPFVNCIMSDESMDEKGEFKLPLYADGYPGIMFQQTESGFYLLPQNKKLSKFFLFGQTLEPVSLEVKGPYRFIVFQLYPFASKYLLGIDPKKLNDDCYDLFTVKNIDVRQYHDQLISTKDLDKQIEIISNLMEDLILKNEIPPDDRIQQVIRSIIEREGQVKIKDIKDDVFLTERTLERNFLNQTGLSPKQFAKIIQFQSSLNKLTQSSFEKLTHVGLDSGFTDQSHFIRAFKRYTGQTPSYYLKHANISQ